jgi:glycosyltransferase involved in cell wall biosynthesis
MPMNRAAPDNRPLVSIVIPYYDGKTYIGEAVRSVIKQSYGNWELIIVDDGSQEDPEKYLSVYLEDDRINLTRHEHNRGIAASRNTGIRRATGSFLAFLDQDDTWLPRKLASQIAAFERGSGQLGMVCTGMYFTNSMGRIFAQFTGYDDTDHRAMVRRMFLDLVNSGSIMMIRRALPEEMGLFDEGYAAWDDLDFWMRVAEKYRITYIRQALVMKRIHPGNTSHQNVAKLLPDGNRALEAASRIHPFLHKAEHIAKANMLRRYGSDLLFNHHVKEGRACLRRSILMSGRSWKTYGLLLVSLLGDRRAVQLNRIGTCIRNRQSRSFAADPGQQP